jgi:uncharacterized protein (DUF1501 family)
MDAEQSPDAKHLTRTENPMSRLTRRTLLRNGSLALVALGLPPAFLTRAASAQERRHAKTLVAIFQRGAVDGLSMVVPFGDRAYAAQRRATRIPAPLRDGTGAIDLDGFFGLHPALAPLHPLYTRGDLAIVHAIGSPHPTRSHFDAQDFMETATPGIKSTRDGWLNRVLQQTSCRACGASRAEDGAAHTVDHLAGQTGLALASPHHPALRGVALGAAMPRSLRGAAPSLALTDLQQFSVGHARGGAAQEAFERLYDSGPRDIVSGAAGEAFEAARILQAIGAQPYRPASGVQYPAGAFGRSLQQIAQLLKSGVGVEIAFTDIGGWDTHQGQGGVQGQLANRFTELARGLRALHDDLGDRMEDVVVLTMSEFGRTVAENGTGGTDHGCGTCMLALGGRVAGGRVLGDWPGLEREQLHDGRDLARTTDFRDLFAEVAVRHLGTGNLDQVFPGHAIDPSAFRGVIA